MFLLTRINIDTNGDTYMKLDIIRIICTALDRVSFTRVGVGDLIAFYSRFRHPYPVHLHWL